jgi:hypothetical protein
VSGKVYYPDGASFQAGISLAGWAAFAAKATEGTGYVNPAYTAMKTEAARRGARFAAYHFLHAGNGAAQADHCHAVVGNGVPVMIDHEPTAGALRQLAGLPPAGPDGPAEGLTAAMMGAAPDWPEHLEGGHLARLNAASAAEPRLVSNPAVADAAAFCDRFRALGGTVHLLYLPRWYWGQIGSPSLAGLAGRGLHLVTSNYSGSPENGNAAGWQTYGGMPKVLTWQYSAAGTVNGMRPVDLNCFRGSGSADVNATKAELWNVWTAGQLAGHAPPRPAGHPLLREGASGAEVRLAQGRLNTWGARLAADGQFGPATKAATEAFQSRHAPPADGVIGPATWAALLKAPA